MIPFASWTSVPNMKSFVFVVLALVASTQANVVYRKLKLEDRIVGGQIAVPNSFPYQVFMLMTDANGDTFQCGGSLLTTSTVLTAAHCVKDYVSIRIFLGAHDIRLNEATQQRRQAAAYTFHGQYNEQTIANDIAIVTLDSPVTLNQYVTLTRLPTRADVGTTYAGQMATISGWGIFSDAIGRPSDILRYVSTPVVENAVCAKDYGYIANTQICIDGTSFKSSCQGDSGGPLVTGPNRVQIGIVSFGRKEGCEKGFDPVFTRVTEFLDWIAANGGVQIN